MTPWRLRHAVRILRAGGLVAHPTEGVWGLACDPDNPFAVLRLLSAKDRDPAKGLIVIADRLEALQPLIADHAEAELERARADWPGAVTWLLPAAESVPWWLTGTHTTLALRVTAHPQAAALCRAFGGPLVSTSANRAGRAPARYGWQARAQLGHWVDCVIPGELDEPGRPTPIRHGEDGRRVR